jgi:N-acetyl-alpha-D-muramate 1-phosphate uridylyltransferase
MGDSVAATGAGSHSERAISRPASPGGLVGVVLAAGEGTRLRPLTWRRPKALCPVGNVPLVDLAVARVAAAAPAVAVNVHHGRRAIEAHLAARPADAPPVHVSVEEERALGTAGALGHLRPWIDGRAVLVTNADAWCRPDLAAFVAGWDGEKVRVLLHGDASFGPRAPVLACLVPWSEVAPLAPEPAGLYETIWAPAHRAGRLEAVGDPGPFVDCGTPAAYLQANLLAAAEHPGGRLVDPTAVVDGTCVGSVVGAGARVHGSVEGSVVWPGATVAAGERLRRAIRVEPALTVLVR